MIASCAVWRIVDHDVWWWWWWYWRRKVGGGRLEEAERLPVIEAGFLYIYIYIHLHDNLGRYWTCDLSVCLSSLCLCM